MAIQRDQVDELFYQALETEQGGIKIYETAIQFAVNDDLRRNGAKYLEETREPNASCATSSASSVDPNAESRVARWSATWRRVAGDGDDYGA